jgi:hypothetical protein
MSEATKPEKRLTALSFDKIIATVACPWRDCRTPIGEPCRYYDRMLKDVPHKSRFKAALKIVNGEKLA